MIDEKQYVEESDIARSEKSRLEADEQDNDLRWLMSSKRGRKIVWGLLDRAGVFRITFNTNAMQMAFSEGNRNYGNYLLSSLMDVCPDLYVAMLREQNNGRSESTRKSS